MHAALAVLLVTLGNMPLLHTHPVMDVQTGQVSPYTQSLANSSSWSITSHASS